MSLYEKMIKSFDNVRGDYHFSPELLNQLSEPERRDIEKRIIIRCLNGDTSFFSHIMYLKYYNPTRIFSLKFINSLDSFDRIRIVKYLYNMSKNPVYIEYLLNLSLYDVDAYSMLTLMYEDNEINPEYYDRLLDICNSITTDNREKYIKMFQRIAIEEEIDSISHIGTLSN